MSCPAFPEILGVVVYYLEGRDLLNITSLCKETLRLRTNETLGNLYYQKFHQRLDLTGLVTSDNYSYLANIIKQCPPECGCLIRKVERSKEINKCQHISEKGIHRRQYCAQRSVEGSEYCSTHLKLPRNNILPGTTFGPWVKCTNRSFGYCADCSAARKQNFIMVKGGEIHVEYLFDNDKKYFRARNYPLIIKTEDEDVKCMGIYLETKIPWILGDRIYYPTREQLEMIILHGILFDHIPLPLGK